ncbi:unnamed protein product [Coregonus sp. 'balchen']|nr:unnamed protein product [Coregonus sp. 'balchen']
MNLHVSHVGWDPNNLDPDLKKLLSCAGISEAELKDEETSQLIQQVIENSGGMEAVKKAMNTGECHSECMSTTVLELPTVLSPQSQGAVPPLLPHLLHGEVALAPCPLSQDRQCEACPPPSPLLHVEPCHLHPRQAAEVDSNPIHLLCPIVLFHLPLPLVTSAPCLPLLLLLHLPPVKEAQRLLHLLLPHLPQPRALETSLLFHHPIKIPHHLLLHLQEEVTDSPEPPPPAQGDSEGIVGALMMVMQKRSKVIHSSDEGEEEGGFDDEDEDEWDD